jgi:SAM-dependent methyltransferase
VNPKEYYEVYWSDQGYDPHGGMSQGLRDLLATHLKTGWKCLDAGCGDGRTAGVWLRDYGCEYVGVDFSDNALRSALALGLDVRKVDDLAALPFADDSFDAVVCLEVFEHLFQPQLAAAEILRVLRPGGLLVATVPNSAYWRRRVDLALLGRWNPLGDNLAVAQPWRDPHIRFFNRGAFERMFTSVGFKPVRVGGHGGSLLREIPWIGRPLWRGTSSRPYRLIEQVAPSLLAYRLHAVAVKPAAP